MIRRGQCPVCQTVVTTRPDQMGTVIECRCGSRLFAAQAELFREIPLRCASCNHAYLADPDDIGKQFECECGQTLQVWDAIFSTPLQGKPDFILASSGSFAGVEVSGVSSGGDGTSDSMDQRDAATTENRVRRSRVAWTPIVGVIAVVCFFIAAVTMFALRRPPTREANAVVAEMTPVETAAGHRQSRNAASKSQFRAKPDWDSQTIASLLARVPTPETLIEQQPIVPVAAAADSSTSIGAGDSLGDRESPFGGPTQPRKFQLPQPSQARERLPIVSVQRRTGVFDLAYQQAFESYEAFTAIEDETSAVYRSALGETIGLTQHAQRLAMDTRDVKRLNELTYLLAYLSLSAGHLVEASVYGEMVARWGEKNEPATKEALMIAFAAIQEAASCQWGSPKQVGELNQMRVLAELLEQRWPNDSKRDEIWFTLGQYFAAFGRPLPAAEAYLKVSADANCHAESRLAAGLEYWNQFVDRASQPNPDEKELVGLLQSAKKHLSDGVVEWESKTEVSSTSLVSARLMLATIDRRLGKPDAALEWLQRDPMAPVKVLQPQGASSKSQKKRLKVDRELAIRVFRLLYQIQSERNDLEGMTRALEKLAQTGGRESGEEVAWLSLRLIKGKIDAAQNASRVTSQDLQTLDSLLSTFNSGGVSLGSTEQLWLGERWAGLAVRGKTPAITRDCYSRAAECYRIAIEAGSRSVSDAASNARRLRHSELLRLSGQYEQALDLITAILRKTPNVVELQFQAAKMLEQQAYENNHLPTLVAAIEGPEDFADDGQASPVWGWNELVAFLHRLRFSGQGSDDHADRLLQSQFHLARGRWMLSEWVDDPAISEQLSRRTRTQLKRLLATTPEFDDQNLPWRKGYELILSQLN